MRIGFTLDTLTSISGKERVVYEIAKRLVKKHEITLITFRDRINEGIKKVFENIGVNFYFLNYGNAINGRKNVFFKYKEKISKLDLDVINTHGLILANAATLSRIPTVKTYHAHVTILSEFLSNPSRWIDYFLEESISIYFANKIVSISKYVQKQLLRFYKKDSALIYNGIDIKSFRHSNKLGKEFKEKFGVEGDKLIIGNVGRFTVEKNQSLLIRLSKKLDFKLILIGSGPLESKLKNLAKKIDSETMFLKNISNEEIIGFYNAVDIYAHPSLWEGFGLPILEASACKKPVVAFNRTAMKEVVLHDLTGFLAKNEREFEEYLKILIEDKKLRKKFGKSSRKFTQKFDWKNAAKKYEKIFESFVK